MKIVAIDPSVNNVGISIFNSKAKTIQRAWKFYTFKPEGVNLNMKITSIIQYIDEIVPDFDLIVTEMPAFFSSERGQIAAHMNYTIDLAAINYFIAGWYHKDHRQHFAITANIWKGTINKAITARRFFKRFPYIKKSDISEHAIDAAMMLRFAISQYLYDRLDSPPQKITELLG